MIPTPFRFWTFNDNPANGQYADLIAGQIAASGDGQPHPAATPKIGAGAYAGNNTAGRKLTCGSVPYGSLAGYAISIWFRPATTTSSITDRILELLVDGSANYALVYSSTTTEQRITWAFDNELQVITPKNTNWHHALLRVSAGYYTEGDEVNQYADVTPYLDGEAGTTLQTAANAIDCDLILCGNSAYLNGDIDALGIWTSPLTAEDIALLWNDGNGWEYSPPVSVGGVRIIYQQAEMLVRGPCTIQTW